MEKTASEAYIQSYRRCIKATLTQLTAKRNEILLLMDDNGNLEVIETKSVVEFNNLFREFCELNISVKELF